MKISVITVCYNSAATLRHTIESVLSQDYPDIEYIIIDGGSLDETPDIIRSYGANISKFISESDEGIYHALNKGISMATGDVIGFLHSDDFYTSPAILSVVACAFLSTNADGVYGDLQYVGKEDTNKVFRNWISGSYSEGLFLKGWMPPHPAFFVKRSCYGKFGLFDTNFLSAADYELMLRFIHRYKIKLAYVPQVLVKMRVGGKSNVTLLNRWKANREDLKAWKVNGLKPGMFTLLLKPLSKLRQFLSR
ncbi:MAG TPA: glycosyltransferase family 2 protein [Bacteroidia bacterium]|jgi:glycosyltransferase involved in cell wall biosynthesis|nr:glycosyltransferase family 2 protein [Bacteroidia bacterium]